MRFSKYYIITVLILVFIDKCAYAQPPDPGGDVDVPIDGGLSLLLISGVGYGIKRIREKSSV